MILLDFKCPHCDLAFEALVPRNARQHAPCPCGQTGDRTVSAPRTFHEIVPTTLTSKKRKAGYQHSHADRPKTPGKVQVSVL